jgi:hypothetical protein
MKTKIYMLTMLMALVSITAFAQRGGRGHFAMGGGGRFSAGPRVSVGVGVYGGGFGGYYHAPRYYYRPYYHFYGPPIGFSLGVLPYGFLTFNTGFGPYYYYDGTFYQPYYNQEEKVDEYQVVDPPMGVVVPNLPKHAETVTIDGNTYYQKNGTLYQQIVQDNVTKYVVVGKNGQLDNGSSDQPQEQQQQEQQQSTTPPQETVMAQLPSGSRGVEINGQQLYVSPDGMYYQEVTNPDNSRGYKIVGKMSAGN